MALLYVIYPGFLSQDNGIDYQPQMISLVLATLSLALTVYVFLEKRMAYRIAAIAGATVTGIGYLGLVEYEVGFEFVRLLLLFILAGRITNNYRERIFKTIGLWMPYSLIIVGFGIWRLFFFHSERGATDIDLQLGQFRLYPIQIAYHWAVQVAQDFLDVTLSAWVIPISQLTGYVQRRGAVLAILATGITLFVLQRVETGNSPKELAASNFQREGFWLGLGTIIGGLIPIAMVSRDVAFPSYSRYSLVSSVGVAILISVILARLNSKAWQNGIMTGLCLVSILTHHANAVKYAQETAATRMFWWQVSWRVPQFEKNTTLVAHYPVTLQEDYFVWGPASLIYYPEKQNPKVIQPGLFAAILSDETVAKILARERQEYDNRKKIITYKNYRNVVVLTQPSLSSCVHVLDGSRPEYSDSDPDSIRATGPYSEMEHVLADAAPHTPPEIVFGPEPSHGWCFYYQKADLARQKGEWEDVIDIGNQAFGKGFTPADLIEWMPFLQAYAQTGNTDRLTELAPGIRADPYISPQACRVLASMPGLSAQVTEIINSLYCLEQ
jgi:hypothetical protein